LYGVGVVECLPSCDFDQVDIVYQAAHLIPGGLDQQQWRIIFADRLDRVQEAAESVFFLLEAVDIPALRG